MKTIAVLVYLAIGVLVASVKHYLGDVSNLSDIINLVLAVILWPLVLLGVEFNIDVGGNGGDKDGGDKKKGLVLIVGPALGYLRAAVERFGSRNSRHAREWPGAA